MNLNDLIKSTEEKLLNPDLTIGTRRREEAIYHYLKDMKAENEELKGELQEAYNASNILLEANKYFGDEHRRYLAEIEVQQMAISELREEKQELMDIIGRAELKAVDVARERSRKRDAVIGIDLAGGGDYTVDPHNRHHLPEDEPKTEQVHLYTDDTETQQFFLGGRKFYELTIDKMIRHKWPEEKPEKPAKYLVRVEYDDNGAIVTTDEWNGIDWYAHIEGYIAHWWNLPEVTE